MTPERLQKITDVLNKRQPDLTIVLENVQDPHNISAVMRTCEAVGVQDLHVLNTRIPRHKKWGFKSSSSAAKWLTIHQHDNAQECISLLKQTFPTILTTYLSDDSIDLYSLDFTKPVALVFGNEHTGVSDEIRALADGNFRIPQTGIIRSLNISVACAVAIYEAFRQKMIAGHYNESKLDRVTMRQLIQRWERGD